MISRKMMCLSFSAILGGATGLVAQVQEPPQDASPAKTAENGISATGNDESLRENPLLVHRIRRYQLRAADVLEIHFPFTPEFNQTVAVQPDGFISLRGLESIRVEGQTLPEVSSSLRTVYGKFLHDPVINVELKDFEKPYFIVGGEVGHPGKFELRDETTTAEAVAIAGGFKDSSKHSEVLLFHRVPGGWVRAKKVNLKKMLKEANLDEDVYLQSGDFLYVPKNTLSKIERFIPTSSLGMYTNPVLH